MSDEAAIARASAKRALLALDPRREPFWIPGWSSRLLEDLVDTSVTTSGSVRALLGALWEILEEERVRLVPFVENFCKDVVVLLFTRHRAIYDADDFGWMVEGLRSSRSPTQGYLAALALPLSSRTPETRVHVLRVLEGTEQESRVRTMLEDD